jgi:putative transposase
VKFGFIAKHRGIWAVDWMCGALGVSRGGFYAWLTRPRSRHSRSNEELGVKVRASFVASDRTYGARRVWHDLLAEGVIVWAASDRAIDAPTGSASPFAPASTAARSR